MSYAPAKILEARAYLLDKLDAHPGVAVDDDLDPAEVGIVGNTKTHFRGYHLGKDRIFSSTGQGWDDYSVKHRRDKAGLSNGSSALDVGRFSRTIGGRRLHLVGLTAWAVAEARAGRRPDTREIIGPGSDGRAYRWAAENGWRAERRDAGDSHEWHMHESFYRDSEHRDKIKYYRPYVEGDSMSWGQKLGAQKWALDGGLYEGINLDHLTGGWHQENTNAHVRALRQRDVKAMLAGQVAIMAKLDGQDDGATRQIVADELAKAAELERAERQAEYAAMVGQLQAVVTAEHGQAAGEAAARVLAEIIQRGALPTDQS